jgi:hypothetical protein
MLYFFGLLLLAALAYLALASLARADPRSIATGLRWLLPAGFGVLAVMLALAGHPGSGVVAVVAAVLLMLRAMRKNRNGAISQTPLIRSPWLELQVGTGRRQLDGTVLAGEFEGSRLSTLGNDTLLNLRQQMESDAESVALMETYLDRRMPGWRGDTHTHVNDGLRGAPSAGAMAHEEAYQILGLEPGASAADIRKAHRRLSERMRVGSGPVLLQNRIDEARDVLLARHD